MEWVRMINIIREQAKEMIMQTLIYNGNSFIKQITIIGYGMLAPIFILHIFPARKV